MEREKHNEVELSIGTAFSVSAAPQIADYLVIMKLTIKILCYGTSLL